MKRGATLLNARHSFAYCLRRVRACHRTTAMKNSIVAVIVFILFYHDVSAQANAGLAVSLDGSGGFVALPTNLFRDSTVVTLEAWINTSSGGIIFGYQDAPYPTTPTQHVPATYVGVDGLLRGEFWWGGGAAPMTSSSTVNDGAWHHVALVGNTDAQRLYLDGEVIALLTGLIDHLSMSHNHIGGGFTHQGWPSVRTGWFAFNGLIDEVRIWKTARSQDQIQATLGDTLGLEYRSTADSGLVAYWRFDELEDLGVNGDGSDDVRDYSVNSNHADLVGNAVLVSSTVPLNVELIGPGTLDQFDSGQNYPNPFSSSTTIQFRVPKPSYVSLKVYDLQGKLVATLVQGRYSAGLHQTEWDARGLASGVLLYRMQADEYVTTKRLVLLK